MINTTDLIVHRQRIYLHNNIITFVITDINIIVKEDLAFKTECVEAK